MKDGRLERFDVEKRVAHLRYGVDMRKANLNLWDNERTRRGESWGWVMGWLDAGYPEPPVWLKAAGDECSE